MTKCELCLSEAKTYCESDRASLCWDCDARVHSANFLVAKHSRALLCRACHSPTPWTCSGAKLCPTVSVCQACLSHATKTTIDTDDSEQQDEHDDRYDDSDDTEEEEEEEEEEESEEENQVVPWSNPGQQVSSSSRSDRGSSMSSNGLIGGQTSSSVSDTAFSWRSRYS